MKKLSIASAFSLVELLVVVSTIGIISALAVPAYKTYTYKTMMNKAYMALRTYGPVFRSSYGLTGTMPASIVAPPGLSGNPATVAAATTVNLTDQTYFTSFRYNRSIGSNYSASYVRYQVNNSGFGISISDIFLISVLVVARNNGTLSTLCGVGTTPSGSGVDYTRILPLLPSDCQLTNLDLNNTTVLQNYQIN